MVNDSNMTSVTTEADVRAPLLASSSQSSIRSRSFRSLDPFSRSFSIQRNLKSEKIYCFEAFAHFLKGNIGSGFLSIPYALSLAGLALGPPLLVLVASVSLFCMLLVDCADELQRRHDLKDLGYGDVVELAFKDYFHNDGKLGRRIVDSYLVITQIGICSIYFILISENIKAVVENYYPDIVINIKVYIVVVLVFIILTSFIWSMKALAKLSVMGNVTIFAGLALVLVYVLFNMDWQEDTSDLIIGRVRNLPIFLGMVIYSYEGIGLNLPLRSEMLEPEKFPYVAAGGTLVVCIGQVVFGVLGFLCFKYDIGAIISFNLGKGVVGSLAQVAVSICIYLTYPLMFYIPVDILSDPAKKKFMKFHSFTVEFWLRVILVIVTFLFAVLIPHIDLFIALIGALTGSSLALIFPPMAYIMVFRPTIGKRTACILTMLFGSVGAVFGTIYALKDIVCVLSGLPQGGDWPCKPPPEY